VVEHTEEDGAAPASGVEQLNGSGGVLKTPDGRYIVVRGRLWRCTNPSLSAEERSQLQKELMAARRAKGVAMRAGDADAREEARARCDAAKVSLGERGPVWWSDGQPDLTQKMARTGPYADWFASLPVSVTNPVKVKASRKKKQSEPVKDAAAVLTDTEAVTAAAGASVTADTAASTASSPVKRRSKKAKVDPEYNADDYHPQALVSRKFVGAHVSAAGGPVHAVYNASTIGARAFALDTRSKRKWTSPPLKAEDAAAFRAAMAKFHYTPEQVLPHGSYLMNLGSPNAEVFAKSQECLLAELQRCGELGLHLYNFHPGSTCGLSTKEESMDKIAAALNAAHKATAALNGGRGVVTVLECMAGQGGVIGATFEELHYIIERVEDKTRVGVCIDTCHAFAAGYDLRTEQAVRAMLKELESTVGLKYLRGFHINDSKGELGCKKDRHESIGEGCIGDECFAALMNSDACNGVPLILETPCLDLTQQRAKYANEVAKLYAMEKGALPDTREGRPLLYEAPTEEELADKKEKHLAVLARRKVNKKAKEAAAAAAAGEDEEEDGEEQADEEDGTEEDAPAKRKPRAAKKAAAVKSKRKSKKAAAVEEEEEESEEADEAEVDDDEPVPVAAASKSRSRSRRA